MIERRGDERTSDADTSNMIDVELKQTKELDKNGEFYFLITIELVWTEVDAFVSHQKMHRLSVLPSLLPSSGYLRERNVNYCQRWIFVGSVNCLYRGICRGFSPGLWKCDRGSGRSSSGYNWPREFLDCATHCSQSEPSTSTYATSWGARDLPIGWC